MNKYLGLAALAALSACGGTGGTGVQSTALTPQGLVGRTFTETTAGTRASQTTGTSTDPVYNDTATVKFISTTAASVTIANQAATVVNYDNNLGYFVDASGNLLLEVYNTLDGISVASDMLYFIVSDFRFNGGDPYYRDAFVQGNRTASASMPTAGVANYFGATGTQDGTDGFLAGSFSLSADFSTSTLSGSLSSILPGDPTATFDLVPVIISGNSFSTNLTTTSPIFITFSQLNGNFYGAGANEVGGTILLETSSGNAAGIFGGVKQ
jgi:C-lobe and N-lobe beta barrels of Tf-binding protein B